MTDFQAALGLSQIKKYRENLKRRKLLAKTYHKFLSRIKSIKIMPESRNCSYFVFQIFCKNRDKLLKEFKSKKIGVSVHYNTPLHKMTYYKKKYKLVENNFKNSNKYGQCNISLPIYPKLKNNELRTICETIKNFINNEK